MRAPRSATWIVAVTLTFVFAGQSRLRADVLFSDNFNRPNTTSISSPSTGMGGSLAPLAYFQTPNAAIDTGVLRLGTGSSTGDFVFPDHDFIDPSIAQAAGFSISFDLSPSPSTDDTNDADWGAISIGYSRPEAATTGLLKVDNGTKALGVLFRGSGGTGNPGQLQIFDSGSQSLGTAVYDQSPTPRETYHITITVTPNLGQALFAVGQSAIAQITVTGELGPAGQQGTFQLSQPFTWAGADNYVLFEGIGPDSVTTGTSTFDNISISPVPEPGGAVVLLLATSSVLMLRRSRRCSVAV